MRLVFLLATLAYVGSVFVKDEIGHFCLNCCGAGCCDYCGMEHIFANLTLPPIKGKRVLSTRSFVDSLTDPFTGHIDPNLIDAGFGNLPGPDQCLDCCGPHPCCNEALCGTSQNQHIYYPGTVDHLSNGNPERNESINTDHNSGILIPSSGLGGLHIPTPDETLPYYALGKK